MTPIYSATNLSVSLSKQLSINYGEFAIERGITLIKGPNGTGKTTLLNALSLMLRCEKNKTSALDFQPNDNHYEFVHQRLNHAKLRQRYFGHLSQQFDLLHNLTAFENIALAALKRGISTNDLQQSIAHIIQRLFANDTRIQNEILNNASNAKSVADYSGGQKLRIAMARAVIGNPPVLLIDEPTNNMDHQSAQIVVDLLLEQAELAQAVIVVTHEEGKFHQRMHSALNQLELSPMQSSETKLAVSVNASSVTHKSATASSGIV